MRRGKAGSWTSTSIIMHTSTPSLGNLRNSPRRSTKNTSHPSQTLQAFLGSSASASRTGKHCPLIPTSCSSNCHLPIQHHTCNMSVRTQRACCWTAHLIPTMLQQRLKPWQKHFIYVADAHELATHGSKAAELGTGPLDKHCINLTRIAITKSNCDESSCVAGNTCGIS